MNIPIELIGGPCDGLLLEMEANHFGVPNEGEIHMGPDNDGPRRWIYRIRVFKFGVRQPGEVLYFDYQKTIEVVG